MNWREFLSNLRPEVEHVPWAERWCSSLMAMLAISATIALSYWLLTPAFVVAAVGASSVLIFALPASPLAQPWSVFGGYVVSAAVGVLVAQTVPWLAPAAGLAVGGAIFAMIMLRCLHPPAGAVALFAVIGGEAVRAWGFQYILVPVAANAAVLVLLGILLNSLVPDRHYPRLHPELVAERLRKKPPPTLSGLSHEDLNAVLEEYGHPLNISGEELDDILAIVARRRGLPQA
jgi:CBS domain-containing membrane protein